MPRMLGPVSADKWEREVRRQMLAQLPDNWIVVCNVAWSTQNVSGYVRDGQSDFVVLIPEHGMVIVEVKGSRSVRVDEGGRWYRRQYTPSGTTCLQETLLHEPPPEQATRNMHELAALLTKALKWPTFQGAYAYVVAYPNGEVRAPSALIDATTLVCKVHMHDLAKRLRASVIARDSEAVGPRFNVDTCAAAANVLAKIGFNVLAVDTAVETQDDGNTIERLTRQQFAALKGAVEFLRVAILGPAGAGKTLLAIWKLKALVEEGRRVICACFNKSLAEFLRIQNPECSQFIVHIDHLFYSIIKPKSALTSQTSFFAEKLPEMVSDASLKMREADKYEAIIVDEGQDFGDSRLYALYQLLQTDDSQWIFFADWTQDVYRTQSTTPLGAEVVFRLYHNCRNTENVILATNQYCQLDVMPMPDCPKGERPLVEYRGSYGAMALRAWEIIHQLMPEGGAAIICPFRLENSCMSENMRAFGLELTQDVSKLGLPGYVLFSTIRSFKGLEASVVILVQAEKPGIHPSLSLDDLYVACSRARSRLAIITGSMTAHEWFSRALA